MFNSKLFSFICYILILLSCNTVHAPYGTVPNRNALVNDAYGGWISLKFYSQKDLVEGEFIAASKDSLFVMNEGIVKKYNLSEIISARLIMYNNSSSSFALWTALASLLTISNGGFLIFTLPMTLITGIVISSNEAKRLNYLDYPVHRIEELKKYSRFPQGIPEEVELANLKPKKNL